MTDIALHHEDAGTGAPPLVFVHGYMGKLAFWRPQLDHFGARYRAIGCDLRGHGRTPAGSGPPGIETLGGDVAALLEQLDVSGAVLVGHSMGCRVVLEARRQAPHRVAALVLVDGSNMGMADKQAMHDRLDAAIDAVGFQAFARKLLEDMFVEGHDPDLREEVVREGLRMPEAFGRTLFHSMLDYDSDSAVPALQACDVPVLVLQSTAMGADRVRRSLQAGERSPFMELVRAHCPHAQYAVVPGAGHYVQLDAPAQVNGEIEAYLARMDG